MTTQVRLYGPSFGHSSFSRVIMGMKHGLEKNFAFAGLVPTDASYDEEAIYPGHEAQIGVYVGPPDRAPVMKTLGWHKELLYLLPPNSTWLPRGIMDNLSKNLTGFISPSGWGKKILEGYTNRPVQVWHHGVLPSFERSRIDFDARLEEYRSGTFEVAHLASTAMQRKGTRELIEAWGHLVSGECLGACPVLHLVMDGNARDFEPVVRKYCTTPKARESVVWIDRMNMSAETVASFYRRHHLVIQPSRGEGFGFVPLEARACGVLSAMTLVGGHMDHGLACHYAGIVSIRTGSLTPIDDGPGAFAPSLHAVDIELAIREAYGNWPTLGQAAFQEATAVHHDWCWEETTNRWLDTYWEI